MNPTLTITQGGRTVCTQSNWIGSGQWSDVVKLYAPVAGRAWLAVDGQRRELRPNTLYLIPPHHRLTFGAKPIFEVDWLHFMVESPLADLCLARLPTAHEFPPPVIARWLPVARQCAALFEKPDAALVFRTHAMLCDLLGHVMEGMPAVELDPRLLPALRYMDDHVTPPVSLAHLAALAHLSTEHFHRLFRAQFHTTPMRYLLRRRMARALRLLTEGTASVKEMAAACGYDDPFYFSRVFRQTYHCTPRAVKTGKARPQP